MDSGTIGQRLREIRASRGYTAKKVEALTNRHFEASTLLAWEHEDIDISAQSLMDICRFYEVRPSYVLGKMPDLKMLTQGDMLDYRFMQDMAGLKQDDPEVYEALACLIEGLKASANELDRRRAIKTFENRTGVTWQP